MLLWLATDSAPSCQFWKICKLPAPKADVTGATGRRAHPWLLLKQGYASGNHNALWNLAKAEELLQATCTTNSQTNSSPVRPLGTAAHILAHAIPAPSHPKTSSSRNKRPAERIAHVRLPWPTAMAREPDDKEVELYDKLVSRDWAAFDGKQLCAGRPHGT